MLVNSEATLSTIMIHGNADGGSGGDEGSYYGGSYYGGGYYNRFGPSGSSSSGDGLYYYDSRSDSGGYGSDFYGSPGSSSSYGYGSSSGSLTAGVQFDPFYNPVVSFNLTLPAVSPSLYPGGEQGLIQVGI
jgi:hypothetical protein